MHLPYLTKMLRKYTEFLNVLRKQHVRASTRPYVSIAILIVYLSFSMGSTQPREYDREATWKKT
jgi:hypothetical protein